MQILQFFIERLVMDANTQDSFI